MTRAVRLGVCLLVMVFGATGCAVHGLSFVQDKRVDITSPNDRSKVQLPLRVAWTADDYAGAYGVLVDQAPPRPGETLPWLFRGNDTCRGASGKRLCSSRSFLAERNVFSTRGTSFTIERVERFTGDDRRRQFHEVTVVLLGDDGRRIGEGAWSVQFEVADTDG